MPESKIVIYTKAHCPYCVFAKELLNNEKLPYQEIHVDENPEQLKEMIERSGLRTVPQIFINAKSIGGFDALKKLRDTGQLHTLVEEQNP